MNHQQEQPSIDMPPNPSTIKEIFKSALGEKICGIKRFTNGICHFVYDVSAEGNRRYVIRIANESTRDLLAGGVFWNEKLLQAGVPVAKVLSHDLDASVPFMILERINGTDIGNLYGHLDGVQKRRIAEALISIQEKVSSLGNGSKFGYALSFTDLQSNGKHRWLDVLDEGLERSRSWASGSKLIPASVFSKTGEVFNSLNNVFDEVEAIPFLDDATTKNVIIHNGNLEGIVDTDEICFGDSLISIALTEMSLTASGQDTDFAAYLRNQMKPEGDWKTRYLLYLLGFCVTFLSESNQAFNGNNKHFNDAEYVKRLLQLFDFILSKLNKIIRAKGTCGTAARPPSSNSKNLHL